MEIACGLLSDSSSRTFLNRVGGIRVPVVKYRQTRIHAKDQLSIRGTASSVHLGRTQSIQEVAQKKNFHKYFQMCDVLFGEILERRSEIVEHDIVMSDDVLVHVRLTGKVWTR
jgi:hypothetical protein